MAAIDPKGMYSGDRMMRLSVAARLHWPYIFLLCNGHGRFEVSYRKIIWDAYQGFAEVPSQREIYGYIQEYAEAHLLLLYEANGSVWGQWDVPVRLLPVHKTRVDERSPAPPEPRYKQWREEYTASKSLEVSQKLNGIRLLENLSGFLHKNGPESTHGIGVGIGIGIGVLKPSSPAAPDEGLFADLPQNLETLEETETGNAPNAARTGEPDMPPARNNLESLQRGWFDTEYWPLYWRKVDKADALKAFKKHATSEAMKDKILDALKIQRAYYLSRDREHQPHASTWLNKRRYEDAPEEFSECAMNASAPPKFRSAMESV